MVQTLIELVKNLPPELATMILAMLPVTELRASIPVALTVFGLSVPAAYFWSVIGDFIPATLILWLLGPLAKYLMDKSPVMRRFFTWLFARTRRKIEKKYLKYGELALMFFVAIPLPLTGSWTGALGAWLFGVEKKQALIFISLGILIAGLLVSILSVGGISLFTK